ncbi:TPR domain protein [Lentisphaera araneosa HTCC2155]|uniref:TPR domain protein n=1 Tax=Lentisphaera araneosa HTCC2155 TaxID=313628 RepID=A6DQ97_9BACT|nr:inovirus-type Gp2 protein [Lentisphaera araneosa]EDM26148.1 TPR domain protein [Lentisphaera araneosa HTCC2155]
MKKNHKLFIFGNVIFQLFIKALSRKRNIFIRLDLKFPANEILYNEQGLLNQFLKDFRQYMIRQYYKKELKAYSKKMSTFSPYGEIIYAWKREKDSSDHGHYHLFILLDGQKVNNKKSAVLTAKRIWNNFFDPVTEEDKKKGIKFYNNGLVSYRSHNEENGIRLDQYNYLTKEDKENGLSYPSKDFLFFLNSAIRQSLYLAKSRTSDCFDKNNNCWSTSSLPKKTEIHEPSTEALSLMFGERFNKEQLIALSMILEGISVNIDGPGGTGKSRIIKEAIALTKRKTLIVSPSASAARLVGGITIHSAFALPLEILKPDQVLPKLSVEQERFLSSIEILIFDESSRIRPDTLLHVDRRLRQLQDPQKPFGGVQIIMVGDMAQGSAILSPTEYREYYKHYGSLFPFHSASWISARFKRIELIQNYRQICPYEKHLLKCFREKTLKVMQVGPGFSLDPIKFFNEKVRESSTPPDNAICLCATRKQVKRINEAKEKILKGSTITLKAIENNGKFNYEEQEVDRIINLKIGSKVLITANVKNREGQYKYVNGDTGIVKKVSSSTIIVSLDRGDDVAVKRYYYKDNINNEAQVQQFPIALAHAITITRSQGMEFDGPVHIELATEMKYNGLTYTAIGRVRRLSQLTVNRSITKHDFHVAPEVEIFYA